MNVFTCVSVQLVLYDLYFAEISNKRCRTISVDSSGFYNFGCSYQPLARIIYFPGSQRDILISIYRLADKYQPVYLSYYCVGTVLYVHVQIQTGHGS